MSLNKREEYLEELREARKQMIKKIIGVFDLYNGDFSRIGNELNMSKSKVSRLLSNKDDINDLINEGIIDRETIDKMEQQIEENKHLGNKKGGDSFKENYDIEYDSHYRIIGHRAK